MLQETKGKYKLNCADPTHLQEIIKLKFKNKDIIVPLLEEKGQTVSVNL